MRQIPVILDTDPGIDDFFALMLARSAPILDVRAITAVAGNQTLNKTAANALAIACRLEYDCPVAKGADQPLNIPLETAGYIHGENGLGNVELGVPNREFSAEYAWDVIYSESVAQQGALEIIALGPLTNIAIALLKYPDLAKKIKRIVLMGGTTEVGNKGPYGEFNLVADPLAADIVFKSGVPLVMVGLNVTMQALFSGDDLICITRSEFPLAAECGNILQFLLETYQNITGRAAAAIHDALAVAYVINPAVLTCRDFHVTIETRSPLNQGRTVVDLEHVKKDHADNCSVALSVDRDLMLQMLQEMMKHYEK